MRYNITKNNKTVAFVLMGIGIIALLYGFISNPDRAWANLLINGFYFMAIALAGTFFLAFQYAAQAGWSAGLLRIPQAMGTYLPVAAVIMFIVVLGSVFHLNHLYHWMDPDLFDPQSEHYDKIIAGKKSFLNIPFFLFRVAGYLIIWIVFTRILRKLSIREDLEGGIEFYKKSIKFSAIFLVLFAITSSTSAWDFLMSIDTHWYSTLFGWYTFSGLFVSGLAVMTLIVIYLKKYGYLEKINDNHLHDLGKFVFAFSVFWTYLWFSQFMLIWYSNIPEEVIYFQERWEHYQLLWILNLIINFIFPFLILMSRDSKRKTGIIAFTAVIIIIGHWIDVFLMVMPGTVGKDWGIGLPEIGMFLGSAGLFLWVVFNALAKAPLVPQKHPMLQESVHHHI